MRRLRLVSLLMPVILTLGATSAQALDPPPSFLFHINNTWRVGQFAQTAGGTVFAPSSELDRVLIFDEAGNPLGSFGSAGSGPGQFDQPTGVAIDAAGNIYVCDQFGHRVHKFSPAFIPLMTFGTHGADPGQLEYPTNCALSNDGSQLYVTELGNHRVSIFATANGASLGTFGSFGSAPGQFRNPFGIVVEPTSGDVFVANQVNSRIDRWTGAGTFVSSFGQLGSGVDDFNLVVGLGMDGDGNLWATDQLNNRIKKVTQGGVTLTYWGMQGPGANEFYNPWAVFVTANKNIWIGDTYNFRIGVYGYLPVAANETSWGAMKVRYR